MSREKNLHVAVKINSKELQGSLLIKILQEHDAQSAPEISYWMMQKMIKVENGGETFDEFWKHAKKLFCIKTKQIEEIWIN